MHHGRQRARSGRHHAMWSRQPGTAFLPAAERLAVDDHSEGATVL